MSTNFAVTTLPAPMANSRDARAGSADHGNPQGPPNAYVAGLAMNYAGVA